ncbi:MAG: metallophosphoesterase [Deltaproteobacteria bacterium]|nr:metallophosphoesterase [Deltaproteobacteria bacterium]MBW2723500.1 metallophosphoesterase [Deltaproteobacteria bacterium]
MIRKVVAGIVFLALFLTVMGSAHYYIAQRIAFEPAWPDFVREALIAMMALGLSALIVQGLVRGRLGVFSRALSWGAYAWLGVLFYLFLSTAALDLATGLLGFVAPGAQGPEGSIPAARGRAFVIAGLTVLASGLALRKGIEPPTTKRVDIALERFPHALDGFRIVQISDVHIGPLLDRDFAARVTAQVNALEPDLIVVTGDLVDGRVSTIAREVEPFRELRAHHGVYFVTGNHDFYSGADDWVSHVSTFGWTPLRNASVPIGRDGAHFELVGVDDPHGSMLEGRGGEDLDLALRDSDPTRAIVLLAHDPVTFRRAHKRSVGLQLSGHTHGGQIWPFGWAVRVAIPWVNGHHRVGESQLYVSCGTGFWGPPMRLGTQAEITEVVLRPAAAVVAG